MTPLPANPFENVARVEAAVAPLLDAARGRPVFLVDGDHTLSPDDTSRTFLRAAGVDPAPIKQRFQRDGYVFEAFRFHAEVHVALGEAAFARLAPDVARDAPLHPGAMEFLRAARARAAVCVVSSGVPRIWRAILALHGLGDVPVLGGLDPTAPFVFGRHEKAHVASRFRSAATTVIGVGDSDVDTELLRLAHHAVVVVNHRRNIDLLPHLADHRSVWQVAPNGDPHPGLPVLDFAALHTLAREDASCR
jgi:phosphoserine phosphatase